MSIFTFLLLVYSMFFTLFFVYRRGKRFLVNRRCKVYPLDRGLSKIVFDGFTLVGCQLVVNVVRELLSGIYDCDCRGKVVLDVGGFKGESAVFFWSRGASKVVVYEPVPAHHSFIGVNVKRNGVNAELFEAAVGDFDGERTVYYDGLDLGFGLNQFGSHNSLTIKVRDVSSVIAESGASVAKFDCEGGEASLLNVSSDLLRQFEYVMVEFHSRLVRTQLFEKFGDAGFVVVKDTGKNNLFDISVAHFKRRGGVNLLRSVA